MTLPNIVIFNPSTPNSCCAAQEPLTRARLESIVLLRGPGFAVDPREVGLGALNHTARAAHIS